VESAASVLAALRACSGPGGAGGSLLSSTRHLDVTAEADWGVAHGVAASGLDDAAALLEQFRAALLARHGSRSGTAQQLLGSSARPLHVHLAAGGGPCAHAHPRGVLVVRSVEDAQVLLCALLLGGGAACCVATAAPALPQAYRDVLVQGGHVGTARPALLQAAPGVTPAWRGTFTAAAFAARGDADAGVGARRALWAEFLGEELLVRGGTPALLRFARCAVEPDAEPCAVEAALEAAAEVAYGKGASFSRLASQWAHATWALLAAETPNEWAGGVGSKIGDDPSVADKSGPTAAATAEEDDEDVTPDPEEAKGGEENKLGPSISVAQCWGWMLRWLWAEKRRDLMWCLAAILWNCLWTLYSPVILTDLINEADFVAKAGENDSTDSVEMRTQHNGLLPDYLITNHISYFIILVCASFFGQVTTVLMNRQLFIKTPCNPGFVLEEGFKLSRHIGALPQLFMDTAKLSQIANVLDQDLPLVGAAVSYSFTAVYCSVMLVTSLALLFTIDRDMALALLAMIPVYGFVAFVHGRKNGQMSALLRREERKFKSFREELLFMSSVKRTLGQDAALEGKLAEKAAATCDRSDKLCVHTAIMQQHLAFINVLFNVFIIGYGLYLVMNGTLTVGAWVAFYSAAGSATPLLPTLAEASRQWQLAREALTLVRGLQALKPEQFRCTRALASGDVALVIDRVSFTYFPSPGQMSLVNVSAVVPAGSKVALCGRSGCGKTTLLRLLSRLYQPTSGCIYVSGIGLNQLDMGALVSVVEQEIVLFDLSIRENIRIARPESTDKEVEEAAVRAAVAPDIALLDGGYNFAVGPRGRLLSGGQRQRVGFARALLRDSPMLLMDEPVSAQDGETLAAMAESVTSCVPPKWISRPFCAC
jgi:ABC-type multidrug transport system fused ATPase/permease subunit